MHLHLRQDEMLKQVLPYTVKQCARALVMPNTLPPVLTASDLNNYRKCILENVPEGSEFTPLMTFKVNASIEPVEIGALKEAGAVAGKLYPEGVTTNSEDGVSDFKALYPVYEEMEKQNLILCIHGEEPGEFSLDREKVFLETLLEIVRDFPALRVILEHATTKDAVDCVLSLPDNVACTLTVHHLYLTLDDIIGGMLNPHVFCKPVAKLPGDREALVKAAMSGNPKFFMGTDSAPHTVDNKECECGAAGVYSAPVMLPALAQIFEESNSLDKLEPYVSEFGARFYGLPLNEGKLKLVKSSWKVPDIIGDVKPFMAGQELRWALA